MKKIVQIVILIIILTQSGFSQQYLAFEGINPTKGQAETDGMNNPQLVGIGTLTGEFEGVPVALEFDLDKGVSTVWAYMYRSGDSLKAYGSIKLFVHFPQEIPVENLPVPNIPEIPIPEGCINSNELMNVLNQDVEFKAFRDMNSDIQLNLLALGINELDPLFEINKPYWTGVFSSQQGGSMTCFVHALTKESTCFSLTSVEDNINVDITIRPNPVKDKLYIDLPSDISGVNVNIELYDNIGNIVYSNISIIAPSIILDTKSFADGTYFLRIYSGKASYTSPLIIIH